MAETVERLARDRVVLGALVEQASGLLGRDERASCEHLRRAHDGLDRLSGDLRHRLDLVDSLWADVDEIGRLSSEVADWAGTDNDVEFDRLVTERARRVFEFVGRDRHAAGLVVSLLDEGNELVEAIGLARALALETRVSEVIDVLGISRDEAEAHVGEIDRHLEQLVAHGYRGAEAAVAASVAITFGLEVEEAIAIRATHGAATLVEALGWMAAASGIGVPVGELLALEGLRVNFEVFDNAGGGRTDGKVSVHDLLRVVEYPRDFTAGQVLAAQAVLDHHELRARLDTAETNDEILGPGSFGATGRADAIMSLADLQAFVIKAQINTSLGDYADLIDVATEGAGNPDGFFSRADFEQFIADNPDLPADARSAAQTMLDAGWFDRTWLETHREELALGAAVLAGGSVIVLSGGSATPLVLAMGSAAGSTTAAATTYAINVTGDATADDWDGMPANAYQGGIVGLSIAGLPASISTIGTTTGMARSAALARTTSGVTGAVSAGGFDILIPDDMQDRIHATAGLISDAAGVASIAESTTRTIAGGAAG